jgi:hypothetical protein
VQKIEHPLSEHWTAEKRIVGTAETDGRDLHDLLAQWPLPIIELIHGELWEARLFTHGILSQQADRQQSRESSKARRSTALRGSPDSLAVFEAKTLTF